MVYEEEGELVEDDQDIKRNFNSRNRFFNNVGIKSGFSIFNGKFVFSPDYHPWELDLEYRLGPLLAISLDFLKIKIISQSLQLHYYQSGGSIKSDAYDSLGNFIETVTIDCRFDYIGICYIINLFPPLKAFLPYISVGPQFDLLIYNKSVIEEDDKELEIFEYKELNKFNFGLLFTTGIEFPIKNIRIFSEYSYVYNFTPFYSTEKSASNTGTYHTTKGHFISIGVKYLFRDSK